MRLLDSLQDLATSVQDVFGPLDRRLPVEGGFVRLVDITTVTSGGRRFLRYILTDGREVRARGSLTAMARSLQTFPQFVFASKNALVNVDHVSGVHRRRGRVFSLSFRGHAREIAISDHRERDGQQPYLDAVREALSLPTLEHVTPYSDVTRALRTMDILSLERSPEDDLRFQTPAFYKTHFSDPQGRFVYIKLVRNMLWQNYLWIRDGKRPPFEGVIRSFWYSHLKPVLGRIGQYNDKVDQAEVVNDVLKEMVVDHQLFDYSDMGFVDSGAGHRKVGSRFPHVIFFTEKDGLFHVADRVWSQYGVTVLALGGSPSRITTEYLVRDMMSTVDLRPSALRLQRSQLNITSSVRFQDRPVHLFGYTDYDPRGTISIALAFRRQLEDLGIRVAGLYHIVQPANFTAQELEFYRLPLDSREPTQRAILRRWVQLGYGIREGRRTFGLVADSLEAVRVREIFYREAQSLLEPQA